MQPQGEEDDQWRQPPDVVPPPQQPLAANHVHLLQMLIAPGEEQAVAALDWAAVHVHVPPAPTGRDLADALRRAEEFILDGGLERLFAPGVSMSLVGFTMSHLTVFRVAHEHDPQALAFGSSTVQILHRQRHAL